MLAYLIAFPVLFAILVFLKFCEGSPFRSWRSVVLTGVPVALLIGYYFNHALPAKPAPAPATEKAAAYRAELQRTFRRIAGVRDASFVGSTIHLDFAEDQPLVRYREIAGSTGGTASWFLKTNANRLRITVLISVQGRERYELIFETNKGVTSEREL